MFNYTKAELAEMANKHNFIRDTLEKVVRLSEILDYINSNPIMKGCLVLKGGTAINLTVFNLPRLSVDIDLDYCSEESRDEMLKKSVVFYTAISQEEIPEYYDVNTIDRISIRKIKTDLLPVIQKGEFIELEKIKSNVKEFLSELMSLTDNEKEFLREFKKKKYCPELLYNDGQIIRRIKNHPMVLWKMQEH